MKLTFRHGRQATILVITTCIATALHVRGQEPAAPGTTPPATHQIDMPPGEWLLRRARTLDLAQEHLAPQEAERVLIWMEAAGRASPRLADAFYWQHLLNNLLERPQAALTALETYCRLRPDDVAQRLVLFDRQLDALQTARARIEFCERALTSGSQEQGTDGPVHASASVAADLPSELASHMHQQLAELYQGTGDDSRARQHLQQAVDLLPQNTAAQLALLSQKQRAPLEERRSARAPADIEALLRIVAAAPGEPASVWELARALDQLSLPERAATWYRHAVRLMRSRNASETPTPDTTSAPATSGAASDPALARLLADFARNRYDAEQFEQAFDLANRAQQLDPGWLAAQFVLIDAARRLGRDEVVAQQTEMTRQRCATVEPLRLTERSPSMLISTALQAAWFYLEYDPDPAQARSLAEAARRAAPDDPAPQRMLGLALLATGDAAGAESLLVDIAGDDPLAAYGLAKAQVAQGQRDAALLTLRRAEVLRATGQGHERIAKLLNELGAAPAPPPDRSEFEHVLANFDQRLLQFPFAPAEFLTLSVTPTATNLEYGQPWTATFELTNRAPFPITVGPESMVTPDVLLIIDTEPARRARSDASEKQAMIYPRADAAMLRVSLLDRHVLQPGQKIRVEQGIDIGPAARLASAEPARNLRFIVTAILDPTPTPDGGLLSKLTNFPPSTAALRRAGVDPTRRGFETLVAQLRRERETARIVALRALQALRAHQRTITGAAAQRAVSDSDLVGALKLGLADPAPIVRAQALFAFENAATDPDLLTDLAATLGDENWLVRLAGLEVLTGLQGPIFRPVVEASARSDPDDVVRRLAQLYLQRWSPPTK